MQIWKWEGEGMKEQRAQQHIVGQAHGLKKGLQGTAAGIMVTCLGDNTWSPH